MRRQEGERGKSRSVTRSVQQSPDAEWRRTGRKGQDIGHHGTPPQRAAWGVRPKAAPAVQERPIVRYERRGNRSRRSRRRGAATALEWRAVRPEPKAVARSALPKARAEVSALVRTPLHGVVRSPVRGAAGTGDARSATATRRGEARSRRSRPGRAKRGLRRARRAAPSRGGSGGDVAGAVERSPGGVGPALGGERSEPPGKRSAQ